VTLSRPRRPAGRSARCYRPARRPPPRDRGVRQQGEGQVEHLAVAGGRRAHRPVRAGHQPVRPERVDQPAGVRPDPRRGPLRPRLGDQAGQFASDVGWAASSAISVPHGSCAPPPRYPACPRGPARSSPRVGRGPRGWPRAAAPGGPAGHRPVQIRRGRAARRGRPAGPASPGPARPGPGARSRPAGPPGSSGSLATWSATSGAVSSAQPTTPATSVPALATARTPRCPPRWAGPAISPPVHSRGPWRAPSRTASGTAPPVVARK
jgi:hypothetical protein